MTHGGSLSLAGVLARLVGVSEEAGGGRYRTRTVWQDAGCVFARRVALDPVVKRLAFAQALYVDDVHSIVTKIKVREPCRYASGPRVHAPSRRRTRTPTLLCAQAPVRSAHPYAHVALHTGSYCTGCYQGRYRNSSRRRESSNAIR